MEKNSLNSLTGALLAIAFVMAVGLALFIGHFNMNSTDHSSWNIHINNIAVGSTGDAKSKDVVIAKDRLSANYIFNLNAPGAEITYTVEVVNKGNMDAKLNDITFHINNHDIKYKYSGIRKNDVIKGGKSQKFTITVTYNEQTPKEKNDDILTMLLSFVQNN